MNRRLRYCLSGLAALTVLALTSSGAFAQGPPQGGPPPGGPGGFGGPGGPGGPGRGPQGSPLASIPVEALTSYLKLTDSQATQIGAIQKSLQKQRQSLMPRRGNPNDGGQQPDFETMRANMSKMRQAEQSATTKITALLTADQKTALPAAIKELQSLRGAGIPLQILSALKLTDDQKSQIVSLSDKFQKTMRAKMDAARQGGDFDSVRQAMDEARDAFHQQVMAVLTEPQQNAIEKYMEEHPQQGPGGPGGFGGPGGPGGFGGPPPPGGPDGQGGPPPGGPGDGNAPPPPANP